MQGQEQPTALDSTPVTPLCDPGQGTTGPGQLFFLLYKAETGDAALASIRAWHLGCAPSGKSPALVLFLRIHRLAQ